MEQEIFYQEQKLVIRRMQESDLEHIYQVMNDFSDSYAQYMKKQLKHQESGACVALLAEYEHQPAGYVYLYYRCTYGPLGNKGLPGVADLVVLEQCRRKGIGNYLMSVCETIASEYANQIYLEVCLNREYGNAQRLYAKRGYIPDGNGLYYEGKPCEINAEYKNDDEMTLCLVKQLKR